MAALAEASSSSSSSSSSEAGRSRSQGPPPRPRACPLALGCSAFGGMFDIAEATGSGPAHAPALDARTAGAAMTDSTCLEILQAALESGVTLLDTAPWYCDSEERLGRCLQRLLPQHPRHSYEISTKVGRYQAARDSMALVGVKENGDRVIVKAEVWDFSEERVFSSCASSLQALQTTYLDVLQVHDLEFADAAQILQVTLPALQTLRSQGTVRKIGITSYSLRALHHILELSKVRLDSVLTYSRLALHDRSLVEALQGGAQTSYASPAAGSAAAPVDRDSFAAYVTAYGARLINAAPLAMGLLTHGGPPNWHPARQTPLHNIARNASAVCTEWGVDFAQLAIYFATKMAAVSTAPSSAATAAAVRTAHAPPPAIHATMVSCTTLDQWRSNLHIASLTTQHYSAKREKEQEQAKQEQGQEKEEQEQEQEAAASALFEKFEKVLSILLATAPVHADAQAFTSARESASVSGPHWFPHSRHWEGVEIAGSLGSAPVPWDEKREHSAGKGHIFGNFHEYYHFHPVEARTALLPPGTLLKVWHAKGCPACFIVLDIGCNEGNLTVAMYLKARVELPSHVRVCVYGVDVDSELIAAAQQRALAIQPQLAVNSMHAQWTTTANLQRASTAADVGRNSWDVVEFRTADICDLSITTHADLLHLLLGSSGAALAKAHGGVSLVTLFSVTMWIHLNGGDEALRRSIERCAALLQPTFGSTNATSVFGGTCLIEPQPWRAYKNAQKRTKRLGLPPTPLEALTLRNPETDLLDLINGTSKFKSVWDCGRELWGRSLRLFHGVTAEQCPLLRCNEYKALKTPVSASAPIPAGAATASATGEDKGKKKEERLSSRALKRQKRAIQEQEHGQNN